MYALLKLLPLQTVGFEDPFSKILPRKGSVCVVLLLLVTMIRSGLIFESKRRRDRITGLGSQW